MKIRNGFVSNSSSSSFCILGVTSGDIAQQIDVEKLFNKDNEEDWDEDYDGEWNYNGSTLTIFCKSCGNE